LPVGSVCPPSWARATVGVKLTAPTISAKSSTMRRVLRDLVNEIVIEFYR